MEKYKNFVRIEEMKNLLAEGNYKRALEIALSIDMKKLKKSSELNLLYDVFMNNGEYGRAKACVERMYEKTSTRRILMQLIEVSLKLHDAESAQKYYEEFAKMAPDDFYVYIYRYSIGKMLGRPMPELIDCLEKLKETEYIDSWAYELAKLYHKAGEREKCIKECDDICIWFGDGDIVERSRALKAYYMGELALENKEDMTEVTAEETEEAAEAEEAEEDVLTSDKTLEELLMENMESQMPELFDKKHEAAANEPAEESVALQVAEEESEKPEAEPAEVAESEEPVAEPAEVEAAEEAIEEQVEEFSEAAEAEKAVEDTLSDRELAEREVEDALTRMLEEELRLEQEKQADRLREDVEAKAEAFAAEEATAMAEEAEPEAEAELEAEETAAAEPVPERKKEPGKLFDMDSMFAEPAMAESGSRLAELLERSNSKLTDYFDGFAYIPSIMAQVGKCLDVLLNPQIKMKSLIVSCADARGRNAIAKGIIRVLYLAGIIPGQKIARTTGEKVNRIDISEYNSQIAKCGLLIEEAGGIDGTTAKRLLSFRDVYGSNAVVILEDEKSEINRIFREYDDFGNAFTNRIHIKRIGSEELAKLVMWEFYSHELNVEEEAWKALKLRIGMEAARPEEEVLAATLDMVSAIVDSVETRNAKLLLENAKSGVLFESSEQFVTTEDIQ